MPVEPKVHPVAPMMVERTVSSGSNGWLLNGLLDGLNPERRFHDHVTFSLAFKDKMKQSSYHDYLNKQSSFFTPKVFLKFCFAIYFLVTRVAFVIYFDSAFAVLNLVVSVLVMSCGWFNMFMQSWKGIEYCRNNFRIRKSRALIFFGVNISLCLGLIFTLQNSKSDNCSTKQHSLYFLERYGCEYTSGYFPNGYLVLILVMPTILSMLLKDVRWSIQCFTMFINIVVLIFCVIYYDVNNSIPDFVLLCPASIFFMYSYRLQSMQLFLVSDDEYTRMLEKERNIEIKHVEEMKSLIGNMAHDLKTPLSGFINGVETITLFIQEINEDLQHSNNTVNKRAIKEKLTLVENTINNVIHINSFMLMTINRCIDFTKANNGVKLQPRLETINLLEVISMPVTCMRDMQNKINIICFPIMPDISSHIITDRQWLQENLLCLLSNAVKFSSTGDVTISVKLAAILAEQKDNNINTNNNDNNSSVDNGQNTDKVSEITPKSTSRRNTNRILKVIKRRSLTNSSHSDENNSSFNFSADTFDEQPISSFGVSQDTVGDEPNGTKQNKTNISKNINKSNTISAQNTVNNNNNNANNSSGQGLSQDTNNNHDNSGSNNATQHASVFVVFEVSDNGVGLDEEVMQTLFAPFKQAQRFAGGTGLGLYSLAKRIEALKGTYGVRYRSDGKQGSVFWFSIPYRPDKSTSRKLDISKGTSGHSFLESNDLLEVSETELSGDFNNDKIMAQNIKNSYKIVENHSDKTNNESSTNQKTIRVRYDNSNNNINNDKDINNQFVPLYPQPKTPQQTPLQSPNRTTESNTISLNILLVDDALSILKMTTMLLKRKGHTVHTAENGAEALLKLTESYNSSNSEAVRYDVVLMDIQMPVMDGLEATKRWRKTEQLENLNYSHDNSHHNSFHNLLLRRSGSNSNPTSPQHTAQEKSRIINLNGSIQRVFNGQMQPITPVHSPRNSLHSTNTTGTGNSKHDHKNDYKHEVEVSYHSINSIDRPKNNSVNNNNSRQRTESVGYISNSFHSHSSTRRNSNTTNNNNSANYSTNNNTNNNNSIINSANNSLNNTGNFTIQNAGSNSNNSSNKNMTASQNINRSNNNSPFHSPFTNSHKSNHHSVHSVLSVITIDHNNTIDNNNNSISNNQSNNNTISNNSNDNNNLHINTINQFNNQSSSSSCNNSVHTQVMQQKSPKKEDSYVDSPRHQIIIGVSANSDHDTMLTAFEAGIDAFIPKPFNMQNFDETYAALLATMNGNNNYN